MEALGHGVDFDRLEVAIDCARPIAIALKQLAQTFRHARELSVQTITEGQHPGGRFAVQERTAVAAQSALQTSRIFQVGEVSGSVKSQTIGPEPVCVQMKVAVF